MKPNPVFQELLRRAFQVLSCAASMVPLAGWGATANVSIVNFAFSPPTIAINVNDQVIWTWMNNAGVPHTTTSDTAGLWASGTNTSPASFTNTFTSGGVFPYHCVFHGTTLHMTGAVAVASANIPPSVAVTNPPNGAVLSAPASFSLAATAADTDGTVTNVQFFEGVGSLGNTTARPYAVAVSSLGTGDYTFSAVASDNGGLKATNAIAVHVVTAVPIVLSGPQRLSASSFQFSYSANTGLTYVVLRSGALPGFTPINTNTATNNPTTFLDTGASAPQNFYRVQLQPNP